MRDGLYKVLFQTPLGAGAGVVHLQAGKIRGGDAALYYVGSYQSDGEKFSADVVTDRHTQMPGIVSVFGKDKVHIRLTGKVSGDTVTVQGSAAEAPGVGFQATLARISD